MTRNEGIGIALGGGGARGMAHIGVLKVLEEHGIFPRFVAGTSMGALVGALYASGLPPGELDRLARHMDWKRWVSLVDATLLRTGGFIRGNRLLSLLKILLKNQDFSTLKIPFSCVATDLRSGEEVIISSGPVAIAIRASISMPGILAPLKVGDRYLVDGGLVNEIPVDICRRMGARHVIAVNVDPDPAAAGKKSRASGPPHFREVLTQALRIRSYHTALENVKGADMAIHPAVEQIDFWHFHRAAEAIALGEQAARETLSKRAFPLFEVVAS